MFSASSSLSSSSHFFGQKLAVMDCQRSSPKSLKFRASPISAACTATAERTGSHVTSSASLYEVLGIQMGASCQEIKAAYRRLARVVHPDVSANGQRDGQTSAGEFIKVHEAYTTLSDPERRADYDRLLYGRTRRTASYSTGMATRAAKTDFQFSRKSGRRWETDQCW
ncbi:hypothetical protein I3760_07G147300 [Carya illinoinensis]|uniref:J domain-containing protein n=1 Tax=Carya illinoinensis TaxID=32201 RepID=A0A922EMV3_CARIL|nr:hypothetical protein I3760_07G147300 [Carya illinoinensis]KAG6704820.1 hypothetical protein I3842_07G152000 [Carya illinoinensis]